MSAMTRAWPCVIAALALTLAGAARAQETFEDLSGTWWFRIGGKDAGALLIAFSAPAAGSFEVEDLESTELPSFGFSRALGAFFLVEAGQTLTLDSNGNLVGSLELTDPDTDEVLGTLTFEKGKPNKTFTKWRVRGAVEGDDGIPVVTKLAGNRPPETFPVLSGRNRTLVLSGKGVRSEVFDLQVTSDKELGLPAYEFVGAGPVRIDKVEVPDTTLEGRFVLSPKFELFGLLEESSEFGTGDVSGKLKLPTAPADPADATIPKLNMLAVGDRKVRARGSLTEPVEPVLSVQPPTFDFGALSLTDTKEQQFFVSNVGAGSLSGTATFLEGSSPDFSIAADDTYDDLEPGDPAEPIAVLFDPSSTGTKTAQLLFDVDGGRIGAQIVTLTGVGGVAVIGVDPEAVEFPDTRAGTVSAQVTITVRNDGDGVLEGTAKVTTNATEFELVGASTGEITYNVAPGDSRTLAVRFRPTTPGNDKTGTLTLTGGGGKSVSLTGDGT